jgi:hypothetical protein
MGVVTSVLLLLLLKGERCNDYFEAKFVLYLLPFSATRFLIREASGTVFYALLCDSIHFIDPSRNIIDRRPV